MRKALLPYTLSMRLLIRAEEACARGRAYCSLALTRLSQHMGIPQKAEAQLPGNFPHIDLCCGGKVPPAALLKGLLLILSLLLCALEI